MVEVAGLDSRFGKIPILEFLANLLPDLGSNVKSLSLYLPPGPNDYLFGMRTMSRMKRDVLGSYAALHDKFGDVVSFATGPYRLFIFFHPEHVHEVLVRQAKSLVRLPRIMKTFAQWNGESVLIVEGEQWIRQRRLVQPAFQPRRMEDYGQTMVSETRRLAESWRKSIERDGYIDVDIDEAMTGLTLSIICKTMFDTDVDDEAAGIAEAVAELSRVAFHEMQAPLRWPLWLPTPRNRRKRRSIELLDSVVWRIVRARRAEGRDHRDLLSMLLAAVDEESGGARLDDHQVRNEAMTLMLAGHDTSAAAMDWLWYALATNRAVFDRCCDEVDSVVGKRDPRTDDVARLEYLVATIKETLRLYPPAIGVFLRQATSDLTIGGYDVPRGSLITLSSFVTQRDARWFPEPDRFDPERFLSERADKIPDGAYFPFGAGPRICIGQSFAMTEMALVAASLLQKFEVTTVPGAEDPTLHVTMTLRPKQRLMLRWRIRGKS